MNTEFDAVSHGAFVDLLRARNDDMCSEAADRIGYLFVQEDLLQQWQDKAEKLAADIAEIERPLDAQMAALNRRIIELNAAQERLQAEAYAAGRADECEESAKLLEALKAISKLIPAECPREGVEYTDAEWESLCAATVLVYAAIDAYESGVDSGGTGAREGAGA